ncbi:MAG: hypothetical protein WCF85_12345 [Rhodospirillaceae bacterium]
MKKLVIPAVCALSLVLAPLGTAVAQSQPADDTAQGARTIYRSGGGSVTGVMSMETKQIIFGTTVGWLSGGLIGWRIFKNPRAIVAGMAVGTLFPIWMYLTQD